MIIMLILVILIIINQPILTSSLFNNGYQRYHFRGDPNRNMSVTTYFDKIIPYLRVLIDKNKLYEQKL